MFVTTLFTAGDNKLREITGASNFVRETDTGSGTATTKALRDLALREPTQIPVAKVELRSMEFTGMYGRWWVSLCYDCGSLTLLQESPLTGRVTVPPRSRLLCAGCTNERIDAAVLPIQDTKAPMAVTA